MAALDALAAACDDPAAVLEVAHGDFLDSAVDHALRVGVTDVGVAAARRILELDPVNEQAHRALMRLFLDAGQPSAALAQFDTYVRAVPIAAPRRDLITGRAARLRGRERTARRLIARALRRAEDLGMPWEADQARVHLATERGPATRP